MATKRARHGWQGKTDPRWIREQRPLANRVGNRFRRHVRTKSNPRGRIVRPDRCTYCPHVAGQVYASGLVIEIQACHINYRHPFEVLWCCQGCHRKLERGTLKWRQRDLHDYTSLVRPKPHRWLEGVPF